jgi:hypothetical protein
VPVTIGAQKVTLAHIDKQQIASKHAKNLEAIFVTIPEII